MNCTIINFKYAVTVVENHPSRVRSIRGTQNRPSNSHLENLEINLDDIVPVEIPQNTTLINQLAIFSIEFRKCKIVY
jgi:hypothetical protein